MLAIARALMSAPRLLLIDEPSVGLAPILVSNTITKIKEPKERTGLTVLMAEQNFHQAIRIADRGYIIVHGEIVFQGNVSALEQNESVNRLIIWGGYASARSLEGTMRPLIFLLLLSVSVPALAEQTASQRLERLVAEAQERAFDLYPFGETMGKGAGPRQDKVELTFSDEHRERQRVHNRWILQELAAIGANELNTSEKLTAPCWNAARARAWSGFRIRFISIPSSSRWMAASGRRSSSSSRASPCAMNRTITPGSPWARLARYIDGVADVLRAGAAAGITTPRVIVENSLKQLDALAPDDIEQSALWKPITAFPASIPETQRQAIEAEFRETLSKSVMPALRRLTSYVRSNYLPRARTTDGFSALPHGDAMYRLAVRHETTTDMTPDEIHALGLKEVARVQSLLANAGRRAGFTGPLAALQSWIASNPRNYPFTSGEQVLEYPALDSCAHRSATPTALSPLSDGALRNPVDGA